MLSLTNCTLSSQRGSDDFIVSPATIVAGNDATFVFCPTARNAATSTGQAAAPIDRATRTNKVCFMRGYREQIKIQTNTSVAWMWRRLVFTTKTPGFRFDQNDFHVVDNLLVPANGMQRILNSPPNDPTTNLFFDYIFKGTRNHDWNDPYYASLDTSRITPLLDRKVNIQSGNDDGVIRDFKDWIPFNKNLVYDDYEDGAVVAPGFFSTLNKPGMGDCYIIDLIRCNSANEANLMQFSVAATLYWHEK